MKTKPCLTLEDARLALAASYAEASANGWAVTIAVVDDAGLTLALERMDGCAPISSLIAVDKARTAALGRRESKVYEDMINAGRTAFLSAPGLSGLLEGGIPIIVEGHVVGAVGVSGVKPDQDSKVARAGATVSLKPD
jgi:glc operon protein GlcG